jgi:DNA-binding NarL/FixJ family response regulator
VIDNDELTARSLASYLEDTVPCKADATTDANRAVNAAIDHSYTVYITDLRMPVRDGLTVLAELKTRSPTCEVVVVTKFPELESVKNAMRIGAFDYCELGKDDMDDIAEAVRHALRRRPSSRAPGFHREHLIDFFHSRLGTPPEEGKGLLPQGLALEYLTKLLLDSCTGFRADFMRAKTQTEEIDLVCINGSQDTVWNREGPLILVECKDKGRARAGANERSRFETKVSRRHPNATVGIFVSSSGFAKTFHEAVTRGNNVPTIIRIDRHDIDQWIAANDRMQWLTDHAVAHMIQRR